MLTVVLGLGSALGYALHDFLMVKVVRAAAVWTAMSWSMAVGLVIVLPLALVLYGLPAGAAEWRAVGLRRRRRAVRGRGAGVSAPRPGHRQPLDRHAAGVAGRRVRRGDRRHRRGIALDAGDDRSAAGRRRRPARLGREGAGRGGVRLWTRRRAESTLPRGRRRAGSAGRDRRTRPATAARRGRGTAGAGWALLSSALFAVVILLLDEATALPSGGIAACGRLGTMVVLVPVALLLAGLRLPRRLAGRCGVAGLFDAAGFILFAAAITIGPLAVASVVIAQGGTMAVLLGYLVLHERLSRVQYVGVACTCVGLHAARDRLRPGRTSSGAASRPTLSRRARAGTPRRARAAGPGRTATRVPGTRRRRRAGGARPSSAGRSRRPTRAACR